MQIVLILLNLLVLLWKSYTKLCKYLCTVHTLACTAFSRILTVVRNVSFGIAESYMYRVIIVVFDVVIGACIIEYYFLLGLLMEKQG